MWHYFTSVVLFDTDLGIIWRIMWISLRDYKDFHNIKGTRQDFSRGITELFNLRPT